MRPRSTACSRQLRLGVAAAALLAASPAAADATYLQLPGITGPSTGTRYTGWFEVGQHQVVLMPGLYDPDRKAVVSRCQATIRTQLGTAGAAVAQLVGGSLGTVRLERVGPLDTLPLYQAILRNAVLVQQSTTFDAGAAYDTLALTFDGADVTTYQKKPDGSRASGTQGSFNCLLAP
ncbi:hypothetical protein [Anaeromyxobacter diazotrophicus]|uniref:Uncharacterized protein n=1 Tax=Anaeromyxobacter diazotrophicus TaxID=2590199 RepID=A0A7I9VNI1_9BACT|nr:hypothetical protein [Anaeromyxobacter diazotrophicus]GEJ57758.1 hypothetical protein AMYX_24990 [Anaeromyxobacter diazotrophicus]